MKLLVFPALVMALPLTAFPLTLNTTEAAIRSVRRTTAAVRSVSR